MVTLIGNGSPLQEVSIKTLVGYLEHHQIPVRAIYLNGCTTVSARVAAEILAQTTDSLIVGFSVMSKDVGVFLPIVKQIRQEQRTSVVWGGVHPTALPTESLAHCDFVCVGEGEEPLRLLYERIANDIHDYTDIPNIGYHAKGHTHLNPVSYSPVSLDDLPFPDYRFRNSYSLLGIRGGCRLARIPEDPKEKGRFFQETTFLFYSQRGCKLACTYCSNSLYHRLARTTGVRWYRYASVAHIKDELRDHLHEMPFVDSVWLNDDDLLDRGIEDLESLALFLKNDLHLRFNINATPRHVTREKIDVLARHGLCQVAMGVQTGSERILKYVYKRPVSNVQVVDAGRIIDEYHPLGVSVDYGFILDNPFETDDDWRESVRLLMSLPKRRSISLYSLVFFPGTALSERALESGVLRCPGSQWNRMYHDDIRPTYAYFVFLVNAHMRVSKRWNHILLSDAMVKSRITFPLRLFLGQCTRLYVSRAGIRRWLKSTVPDWVQVAIAKAIVRGREAISPW